MDERFKVGDVVKGIGADIEGLILEVIDVKNTGYVLKTYGWIFVILIILFDFFYIIDC